MINACAAADVASMMLPVPASLTYDRSVVQHVVVAVGEAAQVVQRPVLVLLGRVVEHDVEPHLDVPFVRRGHELGQLARRGDLGRPVRPVDRPEHHRHVAPVVDLVGIEGVHREQFEHAHAQGREPIEFVDGGHERAPVGPLTTAS